MKRMRYVLGLNPRYWYWSNTKDLVKSYNVYFPTLHQHVIRLILIVVVGINNRN